jgi:hypothetical protein
MGQRLKLQALLEALLGSRNVYFQPPPNISMKYPAIVYKRDDANTLFANNKLYHDKKRYQVTVIDRDPDSVIPERVKELPLCSFDRFYIADDLNHDVFQLFF